MVLVSWLVGMASAVGCYAVAKGLMLVNPLMVVLGLGTVLLGILYVFWGTKQELEMEDDRHDDD